MRAKTYTTISGDTWDVVAKKVYGDEYRADWLMQHNGAWLDVFAFDAGTVLQTPDLPDERAASLPPWR